MNVLDMKQLSKHLRKAPKETSAQKFSSGSLHEINPHLLERLVKPCLRDEDVRFRDLCYEAFDQEDLSNCADMLESFTGEKITTCTLWFNLEEQRAVASPNFTFC